MLLAPTPRQRPFFSIDVGFPLVLPQDGAIFFHEFVPFAGDVAELQVFQDAIDQGEAGIAQEGLELVGISGQDDLVHSQQKTMAQAGQLEAAVEGIADYRRAQCQAQDGVQGPAAVGGFLVDVQQDFGIEPEAAAGPLGRGFQRHQSHQLKKTQNSGSRFLGKQSVN